jgi:cytochrome bd ubiquinol oxidase subunit II
MLEGIDLNIIWFVLIGILLTGYAILDGFDLGVGALHLFVKDDLERRIMLNSIGPVWDGNEVWLVTGGGALFAAFPIIYASVLSAFYIAIMVLLFMIVFRAVAIEFRSKVENPGWRQAWDVAFSVSSILIAFLMGMVIGNVIHGLPVAADKEIYISFLGLLNPYSILVGITTVSLFTMHGAIYVVMKTDGGLQTRIRSWINNSIIFFVINYTITTMTTLIYYPQIVQPFKEHPVLFGVAIMNIFAIANIPREIFHGREFRAFLSSCASIIALMLLLFIGLFPNIIPSSISPEYSLNIYNSSSSRATLEVMLIIALLGMPFVIAYTASVYWIYRGKVNPDKMIY